MTISMTDDQLLALAQTWGKEDGEMSADETAGMRPADFEDLADDAWFASGWMNFENHPELEEHMDALVAKATELKLSTVYTEAFVKAVSV